MHSSSLYKQALGRAAVLLLLAAALLFCATYWAKAVTLLSGTDIAPVVLEAVEKAPDLTGRVVDLVSGEKGFDVVINEGVTVTVEHGGEVLYGTSEGEPVSAFLSRMGAVPGPLDMVGVYVDKSAVSIKVDSELVCYDKEVRPLTYTTVRRASAERMQGEEVLVQAGRAGSRTLVYEQVWSGGKMISRQLTEDVTVPAANEIYEYGTGVTSVGANDKVADVTTYADGSGYLTFTSGATMKFKAVKTMTATAYTSWVGVVTDTTATGTKTHVGCIAVDRKVIPLGTRMYVMAQGHEYGLGKAEDTGVRGNKVDLYMNTYNQCIQFGRRSATVYILE